MRQSVLETELSDHRAEVVRLKTALLACGSGVDEGRLCPITCQLIGDPAVATDGNTC